MVNVVKIYKIIVLVKKFYVKFADVVDFIKIRFFVLLELLLVKVQNVEQVVFGSGVFNIVKLLYYEFYVLNV